MPRLIDADALEKRCFKMHGYGDAKFLALGNIRTAPTIDPAPQWIPVTERLPERDEKCLCRYTFGEKELMYFYQVLDYYATDPQPHFQHTLGDNGMRVTHWMPLPKPPEDGGAE